MAMSTHLALSATAPFFALEKAGDFSLNWRRTSSIIANAASPTAFIAIDENKNGTMAPMRIPASTIGCASDNASGDELRGQLERGHQRHGCESGRADGEAFADRGRGVPHRVELIGTLADFFGQLRHLGDAAGVIGDRSIRVDGKLNADGGEHAETGEGNAVETGLPIRHHDRPRDEHQRQARSTAFRERDRR